MSYLNLVKNLNQRGKIKLKGGQVEGRVQVSNENVAVDAYTPPREQGVEYAAKYRAEEEKEYIEVGL